MEFTMEEHHQVEDDKAEYTAAEDEESTRLKDTSEHNDCKIIESIDTGAGAQEQTNPTIPQLLEIISNLQMRLEIVEKRSSQTNFVARASVSSSEATEPSCMYLIRCTNPDGSYKNPTESKPFVDGSTCKRDNPPYVFTTFQRKIKDSTAPDTYEKEKTMLSIKSMPLIELMRKTMADLIDHENAAVWTKEPITIQTSNVVLSHCFEDLQRVAQTVPRDGEAAPETLQDLKELLDNLACVEQDTVLARHRAVTERQITYGKVWCLFRPGSLVVGWPFQGASGSKSPQIFMVHRHIVREEKFVITCWALDWDGSKLARFYYEFKIAKYEDSKSITELECYPITFNSDENLKRELIQRGKKFHQLCRTSKPMQLYQSKDFYAWPQTGIREGSALGKEMDWLLGRDSVTNLHPIPASKNSPHDCIIDPVLCRQYAMSSYQRLGQMKMVTTTKPCECTLCSHQGRRKRFEDDFISLKQESKEFDDLYLFLPPRVHGYLLGHKRWGQIPVDDVEAVVDQGSPKEAWETLALGMEDKKNIQTMAENYFKREESDRRKASNILDPIRGKGEGIVILLHGVPGVGKTMTAETLGKTLRRRLLRIDASDFDHNDSGQVSDVFKQYFHMASSWGALLLLDEADVFLQERKRSELQQNALVSVLLRELEYFQGILIMTTNRIVSLDYAVQSRIHYAIKYLPLKADLMDTIWNNYRAQLTDENCHATELDKIDTWWGFMKTQLVSAAFTGRDIRNIFMCTQLLQYPMVTAGNLHKAFMSAAMFRRDMQENHQKILSQSAKSDD